MGRLGVAAIAISATLVVTQTKPVDAQQVRPGRPTLPPAVAPEIRPTPRPPAPRPDRSRPQPPPNVLGGEPRNLFRARPGTYRPDPSRRFPVPYYPGYPAYPVYPTPFDVPYAPSVPYEVLVTPPVAPVLQPGAAGEAPAPTPPPHSAPPARPPHSGPLYVIPRCYAGDRPPRAEQLRPGCSVNDMRVITSRDP